MSRNGKAFWGKKIKGRVGYSKEALKTAVTFLIENCYFNVTILQWSKWLALQWKLIMPHSGQISFWILVRNNTCDL